MGSKSFSRGRRENNDTDFEVRRAHAEGRTGRSSYQPRQSATSADQQVYGDEEVVAACRKMLGQVVGTYHLFDACLVVEVHHVHGYNLIKFAGGLAGCDLVQAGLRQGLFLPFSKLFSFKKDIGLIKPEDGEPEVQLHQKILAGFLLGQDAVREALRQNAAANADARAEKTAATQAAILAKFAKKPNFGEKAPALSSILDLTTATYGKVTDEEGVTFFIRQAPEGGSVMISPVSCPSGHEMEEVMGGRAYANRAHVVRYASESPEPVLEGKQTMARILRIYLRKKLAAAGYVWSELDDDDNGVDDNPSAITANSQGTGEFQTFRRGVDHDVDTTA